MDRTRKCIGSCDTSIEAHHRMPSKVKNAHKQMIIEKLDTMANATCEELMKALGLKHQTISVRITELVRAGLLRDTGERRLTDGKRRARVYELVRKDDEKSPVIIMKVKDFLARMVRNG